MEACEAMVRTEKWLFMQVPAVAGCCYLRENIHCFFMIFILNSRCKAIMSEGKEHALGVGVTKMSTTKMYV